MKLLVEGQAAFDYIFEKIEHAEKSIDINMFIWRNDRIGNKLAEVLLKAADRGVKINIVKDKLGAIFEHAEETRQSFFNQKIGLRGRVKAKCIDIFYPMKGKSCPKHEKNELLEHLSTHDNVKLDVQRYIADHSKYYIIDDYILIIGGINVEDKELYTDAEGKRYHDYMIGFEDEQVVKLFKNRLFGEMPFDSSRDIEFIFNRYKNHQLDKAVKAGLLNYFDKAEKHMDILMAYIGDDTMTDKIVEIANKGTQVSLMLPARPNLQQDWNMKIACEILKRTDNKVKVYLNPKMVHAKLISIDHKYLTFGSTNLNKQAMNNLGELNVCLLMNSDISEMLKIVIDKEKASSRLIENYEELKYNRVKAFVEGPFC